MDTPLNGDNTHAQVTTSDIYEYAEVTGNPSGESSKLPTYAVLNPDDDHQDKPAKTPAYAIVNPDENSVVEATSNQPAYAVVNPDGDLCKLGSTSGSIRESPIFPAYAVVNPEEEETYCDINLVNQPESLPTYDVINPNVDQCKLEITSGSAPPLPISPPPYAVVNKNKEVNQTQNAHYDYADVGSVKTCSAKDNTVNQEGLAENVLYADADDVNQQNSVNKNEDCGWTDNVIYDI